MRDDRRRSAGLSILVFAILLIVVIVVVFTILPGSDDKKAKPKTVTTKVDTQDKGKAPDKKIVTPAKAVPPKDEVTDLGGVVAPKDETPATVPPAVIEAGREAQDKSAIEDLLPIGIPLAAPEVPGCLSRFLTTNYSSRRGVAPKLWVIHWAGMKSLPGYQDVVGLTAFGNNPRAGVSWNFNIDREGHCHYNVNVINKAWTQAGFNPWAISVEIINTGGYNDKPLLNTRGLRVLGKVIAYTAKPFHIPLRLGAVRGCQPTRAGIVSHAMLGPCGGGHPDVGGRTLAQQQAAILPIVRAAQRAAGSIPKSITATDRITCRRLNYWRSHGRRKAGLKNAVRRKRALTKRGIVCTTKGPRRSAR